MHGECNGHLERLEGLRPTVSNLGIKSHVLLQFFHIPDTTSLNIPAEQQQSLNDEFSCERGCISKVRDEDALSHVGMLQYIVPQIGTDAYHYLL